MTEKELYELIREMYVREEDYREFSELAYRTETLMWNKVNDEVRRELGFLN